MMPRYYFHIKDEVQTIHDREGIELRDLGAIREEATESAREMLSEKVRQGHGPDGRAFVVENEQGCVVLDFPFKEAIRN